ncbi:MAG: stage II sporulation protein M [Proteobacteria bacterium]|nr:stage II sporulation protein M [Pseudomonadota bacterium]
MIVDLARFVENGRPSWEELARVLTALSKNPEREMSPEEIARFHFLYQKASSDLSRLHAQSGDRGMKSYLETLVARAYGEIHGSRPSRRVRLRDAAAWFFLAFPRAFRRRFAAFALCFLAVALGALFGAGALVADPQAKEVLLPFSHLLGNPSERVAQEESGESDAGKNAASFSSYLMTHNIRVSIFALALGMTFGVGTVMLMFYNGVILGAVAADYVMAGEGLFVTGWLLPHGSVEIPAFIIAAQAGLVLAGALLSRNRGIPLAHRLREALPDLTALILGVGMLLAWAGVVEAFFSQYHEPVIPYAAKIALGFLNLFILVWFLSRAGWKKEAP